jgi:hypothetical protein
VLVSLTQQLKGRTSLNPGQVSDAVAALVSESETTEGKADFLTALAQKKKRRRKSPRSPMSCGRVPSLCAFMIKPAGLKSSTFAARRRQAQYV